MIDIVHCLGVYMYLLPLDIANGHDESIEWLQRTLKKEEIRRGGRLPSTLYLQFDNCFRENKNSYMMAYLGGWSNAESSIASTYTSIQWAIHTTSATSVPVE